MANNIDITISAKEEVSKALASVSSNISKMSAEALSANTKIASMSGSLAVARQKLDEASSSAKAKTSTLMSLQGSVRNYETQLKDAISAENSHAEANQKSGSGLTEVAAVTAAAGLAVHSMAGFLNSSTAAANQYQGALLGLSSVSRAFDVNEQAATQAAQQLAADGFMSVTEAANGLKQLISSGFSLPQAIQLMTALKNQAAFNRQSFYTLGEAVVATTEGIKNGNSVMADATGTTKNLSVMAKEAGVSVDQMGSIQQNAGYRTAVFNGFMQDASRSMGDVAKLTDTAAGADLRAANAKQILERQVGAVANMIKQPLVSAVSDFVLKNQNMVVSLGFAAAATVALVAGFGLATRAVQTFGGSAIAAIVANPVFLALTALSVLVGVVVYKAMGKLQQQAQQSNDALMKAGNTMGNTVPGQAAQSSKAVQDLADKLKDISDQSAKAERDFQQSMAQIVKDNQDKAADLTKQLAQENSDYKKSFDQNAADFASSQQDMADSHQQRIDKIQKQLNDELALGKWADQAKLQDLRQQLADENTQYAKDTADKQSKYDQDVANNKASHDQKSLDLQAQLDAENALLTKHAADVASIRNVDLLDEIDKLNQSHNDQLVAFQKQKDDAIANAQQTADGVSNVWSTANDGLNSQMSGLGSTMGTSMGNAFKQAMLDSLKDVGKGMVNFFGQFASFISNALHGGAKGQSLTGDIGKDITNLWNMSASDPAWKMRAAGGPVQAGQPYLVGEEGPELVVPSGSGTVIPARQTSQLMGGMSGITINQTNHNYSEYDLTKANKELGWMLAMRAA